MAYPETLSELANYPKALSHAESGGGGGATIKTVLFENISGEEVSIAQVMDTDGKYVLTEDGAMGGIHIPSGENYTAKYVEPITGGKWTVLYFALNTSVECPTGIADNSGELNISPEAADGAIVTFNPRTAPPLG